MYPGSWPFADVPKNVLISRENTLRYQLALKLLSVYMSHGITVLVMLLHTKAAVTKKSSTTNFLAIVLLTNRDATATVAMMEVAMTMPYPSEWLPPGLAKSDTTPGGGSSAASCRSAS